MTITIAQSTVKEYDSVWYPMFLNISALPPEINVQANRYYYPQDKDLYNNNPLELNAEMKRSDYAKKIQQMLSEQQTYISKQIDTVRE